MLKAKTVEQYLSKLPEGARDAVQQLRATIRQAAPKAEEVVSYGMPAFKANRILVWYAACKTHVGFYPRPSSIVAFHEQLTGYKTSKGAIQFPLDEAIPTKLVKQIVKFRLQEDAEKKRAKKRA